MYLFTSQLWYESALFANFVFVGVCFHLLKCDNQNWMLHRRGKCLKTSLGCIPRLCQQRWALLTRRPRTWSRCCRALSHLGPGWGRSPWCREGVRSSHSCGIRCTAPEKSRREGWGFKHRLDHAAKIADVLTFS